MLYNKTILNYFRNPRHAGNFYTNKQNIITGMAGYPEQTDVIQLQLKLKGKKIIDAKFKGQGSVATIAAAEYLCSILIDKKINELNVINSQSIINALQLPEYKTNSALLVDDALKNTIRKWWQKNG